MKKQLIVTLLAFWAAVPSASAQSRSPSGVITRVWLAAGQNYGFRIFLSNNGQNPLAGCIYDFAYINANHDNYQAYVASMLSAFHQKRAVTLTIAKDAGGFCRIDEVEMSTM